MNLNIPIEALQFVAIYLVIGVAWNCATLLPQIIKWLREDGPEAQAFKAAMDHIGTAHRLAGMLVLTLALFWAVLSWPASVGRRLGKLQQ